MKIAILSMQRVDNYGSLLQSYSLKKILESKGHDVYFLDIEPRAKDDQLLERDRLDFVCEREKGGAGLAAKLQRIDKYFFYRLIHKVQYAKRQQCMQAFRTQYLEIQKNNDFFDLCIIGSDEVFNCLDSSEWGFTSQLFGEVRNANKVITYAASCGATQHEMVPQQVKYCISRSFDNIAAFSVRDENTCQFVKSMTSKQVSIHADPVVLGEFSHEIKAADQVGRISQKYCLIYSYHNRFHGKKEIDAIVKFCRKHKLKPIAVGAAQKWIRSFWVGGPFELLNLFLNASFVITDTFHGAIFSAKYAPRFAVLSRKSNRNKLDYLLRTLEIEEHHLNDINELDRVYSIEKNSEQVKKRERELKNEAMRYLEMYL